ncbi:hypothetical protein SYNPS1DRAFT_26787 [Syncephalis pseudoplumigaleata]|uniref:Uncharacterized protein n=1 Tax=Syncephalis pseudoplumigaleata TaxID=1712513 RepID=A0A4P9Z4Q3_9FUNG|nr:hypothetical protein SYNPS1DRAFT_26787 [Syncephalis pseudoplumigaleata]|eukprot:RKP27563.1 hypothetical protein SYNPS1DRAFT_26787 [Syncephalis pseudoplumigaleata]
MADTAMVASFATDVKAAASATRRFPGHRLRINHFSFIFLFSLLCLYTLLAVRVIAMPLSIHSDIAIVENAIAAKAAKASNATSRVTNGTTLPSIPATNGTTTPADHDATDSDTAADGKKRRVVALAELSNGNGTSFGDKVRHQVKEMGTQFATSLVTGFISNGLGQALRTQRVEGNLADTVGGAVSTGFKVGTLTAVEVEDIKKQRKATALAEGKNRSVQPHPNNDVAPENPYKHTRRQRAFRLMVPTLISGAVATAAGLGVLGLLSPKVAGATVAGATAAGATAATAATAAETSGVTAAGVGAFTAAGVAGSVAWNRTETELQRKLFGIGVRNATADTRSLGQRFVDTSIGLIPNMVGGAVSGALGGAIMLKALSSPTLVDSIGKGGASLFGETLGTAVGAVGHDKAVEATRAVANKVDTPVTQIIRGGHTATDPQTGKKFISHEPIFTDSPSVLLDVQDDITTALKGGGGGRGRIAGGRARG